MINDATLTMKNGSPLLPMALLFFNTIIPSFDMSAQIKRSPYLRHLSLFPIAVWKLGRQTLTLNMPNAAQPSAFSGQIKGDGGKVVKRGPAFLTLSGNNSLVEAFLSMKEVLESLLQQDWDLVLLRSMIKLH